ncbi:hypothetical protein BGZ99_006668 [Dissophora globulifera]|uniref:F-box domain-containing protein n=1 Tax=Dissophora globulifera TaxID=979702 RepID=A0A9P6URR8_9FUNG|nr:hypothetical protein BGZ99_006668 [Dissophora globulifera]
MVPVSASTLCSPVAATNASIPEHTVPAVVSSAYRVVQIPELAHSIAQYLRPVYLGQLRLVSKALYSAFIPYLRLHLHRDSTASWTAFPLLHPDLLNDSNSNNISGSNIVPTAAAVLGKGPIAIDTHCIVHLDPATFLSETREQQEQLPRRSVHSYGKLVDNITVDSMDNFDSLQLILQYCPNLRTLSVTRWSRELQVFRDMLPAISNLQHLNVSFYKTVDLNVFLTGLAWSSKGTGDTRGLKMLKSLDIRHRVPDVNIVRWNVLKAAMRALPQLQSLSLAGVGFCTDKEAEERISDAAQSPIPFGNNTAGNNAVPFMTTTTTTAITPTVSYNGSNSSNSRGSPSISNGPRDQPSTQDDYNNSHDDLDDTTQVFPNLQSLTLSFCDCPVEAMLELDRMFPRLSSLEVNKCRNGWLQVFEPDPYNPTSHLGMHASSTFSVSSLGQSPGFGSGSNLTSSTTTLDANKTTNGRGGKHDTRLIAFPELSHLKLLERYEGHEDLIFEIVKARPRLVSLETHQISLNIETLLPAAHLCSDESRFMKRFSLSPCWSNSQMRRDFERVFEATFLAKVKHLYIQQEMTERMNFVTTLTSLHIGAGFARESVIEYDSLPVWNAVLRRLRNLEVLRIDRTIRDFLLFEGLGRRVESNSTGEDLCGRSFFGMSTSVPVERRTVSSTATTTMTNTISVPVDTAKDTTMEDWTQERPYLQELQITFRAACIVSAEDLERELVERFRFLERLYFSCSKKPDDLDEYRPRWRPGLIVEHRRNDSR